MPIKITQKIKRFSVADPARSTSTDPAIGAVGAKAAADDFVQMHERLERPEVLIGSTYKIKSPLVEHAMYVTINDLVLNEGSAHEMRRPFEVFINSKNMDHFQWIVALTRIMSAVFRKGGDVTFLVDEMKAVFDPRGGYFKAGGVYMPSIVAEIGSVVEAHLKSIGMIIDPGLSDAQRALIADKRAAYENNPESRKGEGDPDAGNSFPATATLCHKCSTKALVLMDGCLTCLNCGYSKCG